MATDCNESPINTIAHCVFVTKKKKKKKKGNTSSGVFDTADLTRNWKVETLKSTKNDFWTLFSCSGSKTLFIFYLSPAAVWSLLKLHCLPPKNFQFFLNLLEHFHLCPAVVSLSFFSGLMKQGLKCKVCKMNVHSKCRAKVPYCKGGGT